MDCGAGRVWSMAETVGCWKWGCNLRLLKLKTATRAVMKLFCWGMGCRRKQLRRSGGQRRMKCCCDWPVVEDAFKAEKSGVFSYWGLNYAGFQLFFLVHASAAC